MDKLKRQIQVDLDRSAIIIEHGLQDRLLVILLNLFARNEWLNYYQGFHSIASQIMFHVVNQNSKEATDEEVDREVLDVLEHVARSKLVDFMHESFQPSIAYLHMLMLLLSRKDPVLYKHLTTNTMLLPTMHSGEDVQELEHLEFVPHFALSWLMTWFIHDLDDAPANKMMVELLSDTYIDRKTKKTIKTHPCLPIYWSVCIITLHRDHLLAIQGDDSTRIQADESTRSPVAEDFYAQVHHHFKQINLAKVLEMTLEDALADIKRYPVHKLVMNYDPEWMYRSSYSPCLIPCLKYSCLLTPHDDASHTKDQIIKRMHDMNQEIEGLLHAHKQGMRPKPNQTIMRNGKKWTNAMLEKKPEFLTVDNVMQLIVIMFMMWLSMDSISNH